MVCSTEIIMIKNITAILVFATLISFSTNFAKADNLRVVQTFEIDAGIDEVWNAFATKAGVQLWWAPVVEINFAVGGTIRSNYNPKGTIGDATTIENTILTFDPKRMISIRPTRFPAGFPFVEAAKKQWSIFYFQKLSPDRTKITLVGLGYTNDDQSKKLQEFFVAGNKFSIAKLKVSLEKK